MPPDPSKPARVLLFGHDAELLGTRAMVLRSVGMIAELALHVDDFTDAGSLYDGVVCCYTASEVECEQVTDIANRNRTPLLKLEPLLSPQELIRQVICLIEPGNRGLKDVIGSPS